MVLGCSIDESRSAGWLLHIFQEGAAEQALILRDLGDE